jgi:hypothetical protein
MRSARRKAGRQLSDFVPNGGLGRVHRFFAYAFVLRPDGLLVEIRQVLLPHVQRVDRELGTGLAIGLQERLGYRAGNRPRPARRRFDVEQMHRLPFGEGTDKSHSFPQE